MKLVDCGECVTQGCPEGRCRNRNLTRQPKGGMCVACVHRARICDLPFDAMPVIERTPTAAIVRCTEYRRAAP